MNISVDNVFSMWFDGVSQQLEYPTNWTKCNRLVLPGNVCSIAIQAHNNEWAAGMMCSSDDNSLNTVQNNTKWRCTNQSLTGTDWTNKNYNASSWPLCVPSDQNVAGTIRGPLSFFPSTDYWYWSNRIITSPNDSKIFGWDSDAYLRFERC